MAIDVAERVVSGGAAVAGQGIEQVDGLAVAGAKTRGDVVVLALDVEHHGGAGPVQKVGNDDADALA